MLYLQLFWEFFKIGLFAVGGGMATLPFLQRLSEATGWFDAALITDMIAISESTPGPIGINMATYVGCNIAGFLGGVIATLGEIIPCLIIVCIISSALEKFRSSTVVDNAFKSMRHAVAGLIAAAALSVAKVTIFTFDLWKTTGSLLDMFDLMKLAYFAVMLFCIRYFKKSKVSVLKSPIFYIAVSAVVGIVLSF